MTVARPPTWEGRLLVLGAGLIGTSLGLAARAASPVGRVRRLKFIDVSPGPRARAR